MPEQRSIWNSVLADLLINLAAAWFAAAFITPNFIPAFTRRAGIALFFDVSLGILLLIFANHLREREMNYD